MTADTVCPMTVSETGMMRPRNRLYHHYILDQMKIEATGEGAVVSETELRDLENATDITRLIVFDTWVRKPLRASDLPEEEKAERLVDELELHVRGAVRNGLTAEDIQEVLLHAAAYAGVPAARRGACAGV